MKNNQCYPLKRLSLFLLPLFFLLLNNELPAAAIWMNGDLSISEIEASPVHFNAGEIDFEVTISNIGTESVASHQIQFFISTDSIYTPSDQYIGKSSISSIEAGQQKIISKSAQLPWLNTVPGTYYLLAFVDFEESIDEANENNNIAYFPINVLEPFVPEECKTYLAAGDLLCVEDLSDDSYNIYTYGNEARVVNINKEGQINSVDSFSLSLPDQVIVEGDQLVKQSANGLVLWQKTIPQSIFDVHPKIDAATELEDGSLVLAGIEKHFVSWPTFDHDSLYLIRTDSDLNVEKTALAFFRAPGNPEFSVAQDTIYQLMPRADGGITIVYGFVAPWSVLTIPRLNISQFSGQLEFVKSVENLQNLRFNSIGQTPCGTALVKANENFWSVQASYYGDVMTWINLEEMELKSKMSIGNGSIDFFGPYLKRNFTGDSINEIQAGVDQVSTLSPITEMDVELTDGTHFQVPFIPFIYALNTGQESALLIEQTGGDLYLVDVNCTDISNCMISTTISNLTCLDNGTPSNVNDDLWTFSLQVDHPTSNAGWSVKDSLNLGGSYGASYDLGPYLIADGEQVLEIQDNENVICAQPMTLFPPPSCSALCNNLLLENPDFEANPDFHEAWSSTGYTFMSEDAYSGNLAAAIGGKFEGSLSQQWPAMPGKVYTLSVFAKKEGWVGNADYILLTFMTDQGPQRQIKYIQNSFYEKITLSAVAPFGTSTLEVGVFKNKNNSIVKVDNWCLNVSE